MQSGFILVLFLAATAFSRDALAQQDHDHEHQDVVPSHGLTLDIRTVRERSVSHGPGVVPARVARSEAARTRDAVSFGLSHPPRLGVEVGRRSWSAPGNSHGFDVTASLWQDLSLGGYGSARRAYADALSERAKANAEMARRDALARGLNAWVGARYGRELLKLRRESSAAAEELLRIAEARVKAGTAPPAEASLARVVVGSAHAAVFAAEGVIIEADSELRFALALAPDAALSPVGELTQSDDRPIDEAGAIEAAQRAHPIVLRARAQALTADSHAEVYAAAGRPFLGVGLSYTREASGDRIIGGAVSIPLPVLNPNVLESSALRAEAAVGKATVADVQAQVAREVRQAVHERHHARQVREELATQAVTPGRDAVREITRRYEAGATELATVLAARREVLVAEEGFLAAAADVQRADIRLEHAVGGPVPRK